MAKNKDQQWSEATIEILAALDIEAEYSALGLQVTGSKPRATGWLPAKGMGREDNSPSAEINVGDGPARGRYRDFGSGDGQTMSLWEFAARYGSFGGDWRTARKHYAEKVNVDLPKGKEDERPADDFEFYGLTPGVVLTWCARKKGIIPKAIFDCGGVGARWSTRTPADKQQHLISFPCFGSGLLDLPPVGYHSVSLGGGGIRIYRGKGVEPDSHKTMQKGPPGLIGVRSLRQLADAKVVWIVEGITDLLALTSAIPDDLPHVAITSGACSYHPQPEWMQHFAGKELITCFDCDKPGQTGAAIWCTALVGLSGAKVRKLVLPYPIEPDHGKDLRDYLTEGHSYADLYALAESSPFLDPGDKSIQVRPHEAVLQALGIVVSGQIEGTEQVEIFSQQTNKKTLIRDLSRRQLPHMILALGPDVVAEHVSEAAELPPGKFRIGDVRNAISAEASNKHLSAEKAVGTGVWSVGKSLVLVGARSADVWNGKGELERVTQPAVDGQRLDYGTDEWYERTKLVHYLECARDPAWCKRALADATALFARWDNWKMANAPELLAGLVCASWIQTCWDLRPLVTVIGPSNSGKTMLIEKTLPHVFGKLALWCENSTEAGIRQKIKNTGKILMIDEFEDDGGERIKILKLLRSSTRGGQNLRGTTHQKGADFGLKHIPWMGSIELGLNSEADKNRFIVFELKKLPKGRPSQLEIPDHDWLGDLGLRLLAATMRNWQAMVKLATWLKTKSFNASGRLVEVYAVPVAAYTILGGLSEADRDGMMNYCLGDRISTSDAEEADEERLLRAIYESTVMLPGGVRVSVSDLLEPKFITDGRNGPVSREDALRAVGIKVIGEDRLFINQTVVRHELLKGGDFKNLDISQLLARLPGAKRGQQQRMGNHMARGVTIPFETIVAVIGGDGQDEDTTDGF